MKQTISGPSMPTAQICINKSRIKVYNKDNDPTYFLDKGQEFQIELFNPTSESILAKIYLNSKIISQGGLVLRPGERVFLDRYIDVANKFKFDVYEVSNTSEVKKAIEKNGDFKVEFFYEQKPFIYNGGCSTITISNPTPWFTGGLYNSGTCYNPNISTFTSTSGSYGGTNMKTSTYFSNTAGGQSGNLSFTNTSNGTLNVGSSSSSYLSNPNGFGASASLSGEPVKKAKLRSASKESKSIETGRVELGSTSEQKLQTVNKSFNQWAFHTVEYKLLPISQKVNTVEDLNIKRYCPNCGTKINKTDKFCSNCGQKL